MGAPVNPPFRDPAVIERELRRLLSASLSLQLSEQDLAAAGSLAEIAALDSVAAIEFAVAIERHFGVTLDESWLDLERLSDASALAAYLASREGAPPEQESAA